MEGWVSVHVGTTDMPVCVYTMFVQLEAGGQRCLSSIVHLPLFLEKVSHYDYVTLSWFGIQYTDQADLHLTEIGLPLSASQVLGLIVHITCPAHLIF